MLWTVSTTDRVYWRQLEKLGGTRHALYPMYNFGLCIIYTYLLLRICLSFSILQWVAVDLALPSRASPRLAVSVDGFTAPVSVGGSADVSVGFGGHVHGYLLSLPCVFHVSGCCRGCPRTSPSMFPLMSRMFPRVRRGCPWVCPWMLQMPRTCPRVSMGVSVWIRGHVCCIRRRARCVHGRVRGRIRRCPRTFPWACPWVCP